MTEVINGRLKIESEKPQQCDLCGVIEEVRPYGPKGEVVCVTCALKDLPAVFAAMCRRVGMNAEAAERIGAQISRDSPWYGRAR